MAASTVTAVVFPAGAGTTSSAAQAPGRTGSSSPRRGIRGASGGLYVGPVLSYAATEGPASVTHATGTAAGGVEDSTGARESDTYDASGATGDMLGAPSNSVTRPARSVNGSSVTPTAFIGTGVQGGSTPGAPIDTTGRAIDTGVDRFGRSLTGIAYTSGGPGGAGRYTYTNFDGRSTERVAGTRGALGNNGRGTTVDGETVTANTAVPTIHATAESSGELAIVSVPASDKIQGAIHANDVNGGSNGRRGAIVYLYKRGTDTDEDGAFVAAATIGTVAGDGSDDTDLFTGLTDATVYVVYAAWLYDIAGHASAVAAGPFSLRTVQLTV